MFRRKVYQDLINWKESLKTKKKAFILKGLRQIGKTTIIRKFADDTYRNVVYMNFKIEPSLKRAFSADLDVNSLITNISILKPATKFIPFETVIIFDEIQECSGARASIKAFIEDGRFDIIASGSLLGIKGYNNKYSGGVPVGFEHTVYMKPMDFEEFLWAKGLSEDNIQYLRQCFENKSPIRQPIHDAMLRYFKEYICVGGMPAVVDIFIKTNDFNQARQEQIDILESYKDDYGKHLDEHENEQINKSLLARINNVYNSIPAQLAKENKKFMYSQLEKKGTSSKYDPAIQWLVDYGLITYCYNLNLLEEPLSGNKNSNCFKLYFADTGLFIAMLDADTPSKIMFGDLGVYKGSIYENIVADSFSKSNRELYYYNKDGRLEIDFVTKHNNQITLVEVKATTGNTKSAKTVLENKEKYKNVNSLIKLGEYNIGSVVDNLHNIKITIPYYLAFLIKD